MSQQANAKKKQKDLTQIKIRSTIRKQKYKELLVIGVDLAKETDFEDVAGILKKINNFVKSADTLNLQAGSAKTHENASELLLDAQVIKMGHELVGAVTEKIGNSEFHEQDLVNAMISLIYKDGIEDWGNLEPIASEVISTSKFSQSLLGTFELEPEILQSQPKERAKRQKAVLAEQKRPETVEKLHKHEKGAQKVNLIMNQIAKIYSERGDIPIPYYELVVDPDDFMNTVDNAFQVSFMVRDGNIDFSLDDEKRPMVRPVKPAEQTQKSSDSTTVQTIVGFNPKMWRKAIEDYEIHEPLLKINRDEFLTQQPKVETQRRKQPVDEDDA